MSAERVAGPRVATPRGDPAARGWRTSRRTIDLTRPVLIGVLNITPDSFSDGGLYLEREAALRQAGRLADEGADVIDIGGESTRPGARSVTEDEEVGRVLPVVEAALEAVGVPISVDTTKSGVARAALDAGAEIINDVSGLRFDPALADLAGERGAGLVLMHMRGVPRTMQDRIHYDDLIGEISAELGQSVSQALSAGCEPDQLVIDPGIGFGKTAEQSLVLIEELSRFQELGYPILVGPSRKSFIGKTLGLEVGDRLEATIAACVVSLLRGARLFRVHDVRPLRRALDMADAIVKRSSVAELT